MTAAVSGNVSFDPDQLREKYREERDKRVRADGNDQYIEVSGDFSHYIDDPYVEPGFERDALQTQVEVLIIGVASYLVFAVFSLNYAALLGLLVGFSVIVPFIGAMLVTIPVMMVAYFQFGVTPDFYWVVGAYVVIQVLDGNVLVPLLFSEAVNLHPVAIVIAVLFFGGLWGLWGVFFAIPLATLVSAILSAWPSRDSLAVS